MSDFRRELLVAEAVFDISMMAACLMKDEKIVVEDSRELFQTIYQMANDFEDKGYNPDFYMDDIDTYAEKQLMLKYGSFDNKHGRVWWDNETSEFIDEAELYGEYLMMRKDRDITFEDYIRNCLVKENGTLELVRS